MAQAQDVGLSLGAVVGAVCGAAVLLGAAAVLVKVREWRRQARRERPPQSEKILRPAGWSSMEQLDVAYEKLLGSLVYAGGGAAMAGAVLISFFPAIRAVALGQFSLGELYADPKFYIVVLSAIVGVAAVVWAVFWFLRLSRGFDEVKHLRMGARGEQAVAEKLMDGGLAAAGYRCFHDLPCERDNRRWNVDHVVVGPGGIFVLETKARSRRKATRQQDESKVVFDGEKLQFPWCVDWDVVSQARRNTEWVEALIREYAPEGILVQGVIVVPGWYVESVGNYPVKAMNAKYLPGFLAGAKRVYEAKELRGVVKKLDEVCRDLEF